MKKITLTFIMLCFYYIAISQPPTPQTGYRWVLWDKYSDEFNSNALDNTKWRDFFMGWNGRPPAKFDPTTISVTNGNLQIRNKKLTTPEGSYTMAGGAVQSLEKTAHFGYYECKFKASRIAMSTTFWLSNGKKDIIGPTKLTADCPGDKWSQELDIAESVGGEFTSQPWASKFRTKINFNTHYRYVDCNGAPEVFYSAGNNQAEGNGQVANDDLVGSESWEDFHTYGCYWKDSKTFDFYVDSNFAGTVAGRTDVVDEPFTETMGINMVTETYDWATPYPNDAELANNAINTSYYDWIRSYRLIPIFDPESSTNTGILDLPNADFENGNLNNWSGWGQATSVREATNVATNVASGTYAARIKGIGAHERAVTLLPNTEYKLSAQIKVVNGKLIFGIKENVNNGATIESLSITNSAYQNVELIFTTGSQTNLKFFLFAQNDTDEGFGDDFQLELTSSVATPVKPTIFAEDFKFTQTPTLNASRNQVNFAYTYKANIDREINIHIFNTLNTLVFSEKIDALEGFGVNNMIIDIGTVLPNDTYTIVADIRPIGGNNSEIIASDDNTSTLSTSNIKTQIPEIVIFPNPTHSNLNLRTKHIEGSIDIEIYNTLGQIQYATKMKTKNLSVDLGNTLSNGIYFITFSNESASFTKKLIIN